MVTLFHIQLVSRLPVRSTSQIQMSSSDPHLSSHFISTKTTLPKTLLIQQHVSNSSRFSLRRSPIMRPWVLVSPASRGIGFALTRHVLQTTNAPVVATARKDVEKTKHELLDGLSKVDESRLTVLPLDVLGKFIYSGIQTYQNSHASLIEKYANY